MPVDKFQLGDDLVLRFIGHLLAGDLLIFALRRQKPLDGARLAIPRRHVADLSDTRFGLGPCVCFIKRSRCCGIIVGMCADRKMSKGSSVPKILLLTLLFSLQSVYSFQISLGESNKLRRSPKSGGRSSIGLKMSPDIKEIKTKDAPAPVGPYSQAVLAGSTLYCSGNIALDPATGEFVGGGDVQAETRQVLKNLDAVLQAAGATAANVVRCTVFLADLGDFGKVNEIYAEYFKDNTVAPSRSCIQAGALPKGALVEIDCIAVL